MAAPVNNSRGTSDHADISPYEMQRIGTVNVDGGQFTVVIDEGLRAGLAGLESFGHVIVTWLADRAAELASHDALRVTKPYVDGPEEVGVFATRSPLRPNPIGLSVAPLLAVDQGSGVISLGWIDALDNTPVLDIKPYFPASDRVRDSMLPAWFATWPQYLEDSAAFDWESVFTPD